MMLYFAHPIDQASSADRVGYGAIERTLAGVFDWVFDPGAAFSVTGAPEFDPRVQRLNEYALHMSDAMFAMLPPGGNTVGTVREILFAADTEMPTLIYCQSRPIGLGDLPPNVEFWQANTAPGLRHEDIQRAARRLYELTSNSKDPDMASVVPVAKGRPRNAVPGLSGGGFLHYYGPLHAERKYDGDAAWDVPAMERVTLSVGQRARVRTGVYIAPPDDVWVHMVGRSSMFAKGLFVEPGVIDAGWRGELEAKVYNLSSSPVVIEEGERIAQLIPHRIEAQLLLPQEVSSLELLPYGDRGTNGWGSTGK